MGDSDPDDELSFRRSAPGNAGLMRTSASFEQIPGILREEGLRGRGVFKNLIPKIFYERLTDGLAFFVDGLGFEVRYQDENLAVVVREGAKAYIVQNAECAAKDRPELAIDTDDIDAVFNEMSARSAHLLHPNGKTVALKPWGAKEFAMLDKTTVCVVFREWPKE